MPRVGPWGATDLPPSSSHCPILITKLECWCKCSSESSAVNGWWLGLARNPEGTSDLRERDPCGHINCDVSRFVMLHPGTTNESSPSPHSVLQPDRYLLPMDVTYNFWVLEGHFISFIFGHACSMHDLNFLSRGWACTLCLGSTVLTTGPWGKIQSLPFLSLPFLFYFPFPLFLSLLFSVSFFFSLFFFFLPFSLHRESQSKKPIGPCK